ncbi:hypothetical protein SCA6_011760 [Theobroma cacao]
MTESKRKSAKACFRFLCSLKLIFIISASVSFTSTEKGRCLSASLFHYCFPLLLLFSSMGNSKQDQFPSSNLKKLR